MGFFCAIASATAAPLPTSPTMSRVAPEAPAAAGADAGAPIASPLTEAECRIAAQSVTDGVLGVVIMWRGDHWRALPPETQRLVESLARVWSHYGLPRVGPIAEWLIAVGAFCISAEQRRADMRRMWDWLLGRRKPAVAEPPRA